MKNEVPQQIANKLIELGSRDNLDEPSIAADFEQFRPYEHLGRIHWREWNSACESLSIGASCKMIDWRQLNKSPFRFQLISGAGRACPCLF